MLRYRNSSDSCFNETGMGWNRVHRKGAIGQCRYRSVAVPKDASPRQRMASKLRFSKAGNGTNKLFDDRCEKIAKFLNKGTRRP